jgi:hypothetical protein
MNCWDSVWKETLHPKWANQRLRMYGGKKRVFANYFSQLETPGKKTVVAFGYAKFAPGGKNEISVPTNWAFKECSYRFQTHAVDEFRHNESQATRTIRCNTIRLPDCITLFNDQLTFTPVFFVVCLSEPFVPSSQCFHPFAPLCTSKFLHHLTPQQCHFFQGRRLEACTGFHPLAYPTILQQSCRLWKKTRATFFSIESDFFGFIGTAIGIADG